MKKPTSPSGFKLTFHTVRFLGGKVRFTTEQTIRIIKRLESGEKTKNLTRVCGIISQTFYRWKSKFNDMDVAGSHISCFTQKNAVI
ncbi:MAG: transposase [Candidatus Marinimicrobia bacterium]|nr:transposase [Candidatus Neomarinimicrobiota bacterium]